MATYMAAWKTFRRLSDENRATARHLLSRPRWPHRDGIKICDIGCGEQAPWLVPSGAHQLSTRSSAEWTDGAETCDFDTGKLSVGVGLQLTVLEILIGERGDVLGPASI